MRQVRALFCLALLMVGSLAFGGAAWAADSATPGRINAERVNVRSGPALTDRVIGVVKEGDIVEVTGKKGGWLEIRYPEGCYMWTSAKYIKIDEPTGKSGWGEGVKGTVNASKVRIRVSPDLKSTIVREAQYKETVTVLGKRGDWYFLKPDTDLRAYISASLVDLQKVTPPPAPVTTPVAAKPKPEPEQSVSAAANTSKLGNPAAGTLDVAVLNSTLPAVTPTVQESQKLDPMQERAQRRQEEKGSTVNGVIERVSPATETETGCGYTLWVGGIPVNFLRSASVSLDKYVGQKVSIHGSVGAPAQGHPQQVINVEYVDAE
ncbi:MAG: SH3 domain-containing protein [Planctomycetota bacterium]